ncbi:MAG: RNA methyltransferase [Candidatus Binataceae bacterium]
MEALGNFAFVLVRPLQAGNVGSAARALKNMGLGDLRLVAPRPAASGRAAASMAVHAADILHSAQRHDSLGDALADCSLAVGTTCRPGLYRSGVVGLREAAAQLVAEAGANRIAIIFGPEDTGLVNRELKLCQRLITIPTAPAYPSLNLAQAVMLVAYELMMAAGAARELPRPEPRAPALAVDAMMERLSEALVSIGFLPAENPEHIMFALRAILGRAGIGVRELDILSGLARQIRWFSEGSFEAVEAKRRSGRKLR